ncbi:enoyl-CoA hydratase-related protein [Roseicitreum antarcticum]|uniref:Enoyl-CoA hydratase n=1 Tax=Roseicitreum antarcticum TaxID=564137 RepID=A0A1H2ZYL7_9RHOB|nr:enoyl-CoA hydratase-related protein [Roseicitreum antarcticum]SDX21739.1 Enoyl-CoA hydratase [Roseicitreum antarcticum]
MDYKTLTIETAEGLGVITLNRPEVMNALNAQMRAELLYALRDLGGRMRALVLTGAGRAFCSGQDLGDGSTSAADLDLERVLREEYEPLLHAIYDCPVPVVAAVNGTAAGAGVSLALATDVVIATESATFLQAFSRIGLMPDAGGTYWLPRQMGLARAMGAMLFADKITARQAADWGMIWQCVPDSGFDAMWRDRAEHLAKGPTRAYAAIRQALRASTAQTLEGQLTLEAQLQGNLGKTRDFREGVMAFMEKRDAAFEGR